MLVFKKIDTGGVGLPSGRISLYLLLFVAAITGIAPLFAAETPATTLSILPGAPEGFEVLEGPRETAVDIFYGGLKIGSFRAIYTPSALAFAAPDEIASKIPALKPDMAYRVISALTGDLPTGNDKKCGHIQQKGCGILEPEIAGIIFYEESFHVDLFVNPSVLEVQETHKISILPPAPDVFSSVHALNGSITDTSGSSGGAGSTSAAQQNYSLQSNSTIAYGAGRLNLVGAATNTNKQITTMSGSLDKWGLDNQVGFFDSHALQLLPQNQISGISIGTSLNTNLALRDAAGNQISIFLPQRAWVSLVYNNVIYSTDFYEAGNQIINTSALPEGAYEVTLRIHDSSGAQTEEKRFFAKHFQLPPADTPIYFAQAGTVRNITAQTSVLPSVGSEAIITGGTVQRLTDNVGINTDFLMFKNRLYTEGGAFLLLPPDHQLMASMLVSTTQDYGFGLSYLGYGYGKKLSMSGDIRTIFAGSPAHISTDPTAVPPPIANSSKQFSGSLGYQLDDKTIIIFQGNYTKSIGVPHYAVGPNLRYDFWRDAHSNLSLTAGSNDTQNGIAHNIMMQFTMRLGEWGYSGSGGISTGNKGTLGGTNLSKNGDARITWNDDSEAGKLTVVGAEARHDALSDTYLADYEHRGQYGNIKLIGSQNDTSHGVNNFYSGNFGIGIAQSGSDVSLGGTQQQSSGIIVSTTGNSQDIPMKVMINNSEKDIFKTGDSTAVFVSPYQTYNVSIKPAQSSAVDYDGAVKNVTLYPGNILPMIWNINRVNIVLGHVILPDGKALANARLEESRNISFTDDEGMFQGEVLELRKLTFKREIEEPKPAHNVNDSDDFDIFSILPGIRTRYNHSRMSNEARNQAMIDLFGDSDKETPPTEENIKKIPPPLPLQESDGPARTPMPPPLPRLAIPALRCEVILPETPETNGVYIYTEPLICNTIAFEEEKKENQPDKNKVADVHKAAFTPRPALTEFADGLINTPPTATTTPKAIPIIFPHSEENAEQTKRVLAEQIFNSVYKTQASIPSRPVVLPVYTAAPAKPSPDSTSANPITVQLGAYRTAEKALAMRKTLMRQYSELAGKPIYVLKSDLGIKGIYYRLRAGYFATTQDARAFCGELSTKGQECAVPTEETETASLN